MAKAALPTKEAAAALGVSVQQLRKDAAAGCPHERGAGNRLSFNLAAVRKWRKANRRPTTGGKRGGGRPRTAAPTRSPRRRGGKPTAEGKAPRRGSGSAKPPPIDDATLGRVATIIGTRTPRLTAVDASALKMETQAALLQLDLEAKCKSLVEVDELRLSLSRGLHASRRYLDASRRAAALSICQQTGLPAERVAEVEQILTDRDDEYARRMRSCMQRATSEHDESGDDA